MYFSRIFLKYEDDMIWLISLHLFVANMRQFKHVKGFFHRISGTHIFLAMIFIMQKNCRRKTANLTLFWPIGRFFQYENKLLPIKTMHILDLVTLIFSAKKNQGHSTFLAPSNNLSCTAAARTNQDLEPCPSHVKIFTEARW